MVRILIILILLPFVSFSQTIKAAWHFENDGLDASGNGNNATTTTAVTYKFGKQMYAAYFDSATQSKFQMGSADIVTGLTHATPISQTGWLKPGKTLSTAYRVAWNLKGGLSFYASHTTGPGSSVLYFSTAPQYYVSGTGNLNKDIWYFVAFAWSGTYANGFVFDNQGRTIALTVNGTNTSTGSRAASGYNYIGSTYVLNTYMFTGGIDELKIYSGALSWGQMKDEFAKFTGFF